MIVGYLFFLSRNRLSQAVRVVDNELVFARLDEVAIHEKAVVLDFRLEVLVRLIDNLYLFVFAMFLDQLDEVVFDR